MISKLFSDSYFSRDEADKIELDTAQKLFHRNVNVSSTPGEIMEVAKNAFATAAIFRSALRKRWEEISSVRKAREDEMFNRALAEQEAANKKASP